MERIFYNDWALLVVIRLSMPGNSSGMNYQAFCFVYEQFYVTEEHNSSSIFIYKYFIISYCFPVTSMLLACRNAEMDGHEVSVLTIFIMSFWFSLIILLNSKEAMPFLLF